MMESPTRFDTTPRVKGCLFSNALMKAMHNRLLVKAWGVGETAVRQRLRQAKSPIFKMMPQARRRSHCNQSIKVNLN